ncbi:MAG: hypothetical protein HQM12_09965 [SAR324 cluster bacterium]|nr:hypothetical protein [SAR324 cluster bacterium]MBF0351847.1 hypothetical protein [SAR324 cluster bacterium]
MEKLNEINKKVHEFTLQNVGRVEEVYHSVSDRVFASIGQVDVLKNIATDIKSMEGRLSNDVFTNIRTISKKSEELITDILNKLPGKAA